MLHRRDFLTLTLTSSAAAILGPSTLAGCGGTKKTTNTTQMNQGVVLPTRVAYEGVTPDFSGNTEGLLDAFLQYPNPPIVATTGVPGAGGEVSAFVQSSSPVPPAMDQNDYWQELNKRLGVTLNLTIVPTGDMPTKFATLVAGGDLPDIIEPATSNPNGTQAGIASLPQWLEAKCQDLTAFLSGDAIRSYPFLANLPTEAWRSCVFNGGIYGLPVPRGVAGTLMYCRDDILSKLGVNAAPATFAEFKELCGNITDAASERWAVGSAGAALWFVQQMLGVPNYWREENGKLTSMNETEELKQALSDVAGLVSAGYVHPDSFANSAPVKKWFNAGNSVLHVDRYTAWPQYYADNIAGDSFDIGGMRPPKYSGGGFAGTWQSDPFNNFTALKQGSDERIKDLLSICDWLAAPFGTKEFLFRRFGIEGQHYEMRDGSPSQTQAGVTQTALGIRYIVDAPDVLFIPGRPAATTKAYDYQASIIPTSVKNPALGLFSNTWSTKQAQLSTILTSAQNDILSGRSQVSTWDDAVKQWREQGGDQVRAEFEEQLQNG